MPPAKRKAGGAAGRGGKKSKTEPVAAAEQPSAARQMVDALKKADDDRRKTAKVDSYCCQLASNGHVVDDFDCMLNQTNIGYNNNKYYVIQVIESAGRYYSWNRWGRVGEPGANALKGPTTRDSAIADFKKKFQDKTKNKWDERDNFKAHPGKYTLLEMGEDDEDDDDDSTPQQQQKAPVSTTDAKNYLPCTLDDSTQDLIKLIFDTDMFNDAMKNLEIDVKKMPLGKISKSQIAKGFEALERIEDAINNNRTSQLAELSSLFYTLIPHNFGRQRPPTISDNDTLRKKMDMLMVLADIELAQSMQKEKDEESKPKTVTKEPHPLDVKYGLLQCRLSLMDKKSEEYKILENYLCATQGYYKLKIHDVWEVDRHQEGDRFAANKNIEHRKLLWHGTNVAVVAAILKSGLRIMPHSGGRVGKGIYFASENGKSACYVGPTRRKNESIGIMFLCEVALGKEHNIQVGNGSLTCAPKGYDSIVARGQTEPDPKKDLTMVVDGRKVIVPQGKPVRQPQYKDSHFAESEYLIYREDQCRIRYMLKLKF